MVIMNHNRPVNIDTTININDGYASLIYDYGQETWTVDISLVYLWQQYAREFSYEYYKEELVNDEEVKEYFIENFNYYYFKSEIAE